MRTPGHDEELAAGFLFTEGIITGPAELEAIRPCGPPAANGLINVVRADLAPGVEVDLARLERHFYTSSSCGVCGKASLEAVAVQGRYDLRDNPLQLSAKNLGALPDRLRALQNVFERTGGLHASGLFDDGGQVLVSREDVGRHNALDKTDRPSAAEGRIADKRLRGRGERQDQFRIDAKGHDGRHSDGGRRGRTVIPGSGIRRGVRDDAGGAF